MNGFSVILCLFLIKFTNGVEMVFEFGSDRGDLIYSKDGSTSILQYDTIVDIPVPANYEITYIKVTVDALSPPKVDFDAAFKRVKIKFNWTQITLSKYSVVVKGALRM